jgi:hypothetical protein
VEVHPKHVEEFPDINKLCKVASCWIYIGINIEPHSQNSTEVDTETKENMRKTEEKLDGGYEEGHEQKEPK